MQVTHRDVAQELPEPVGKIDVWPKGPVLFRCQRRHVDSVQCHSSFQVFDQLLDNPNTDYFLGFLRRTRNVRSSNYSVETEHWKLTGWLLLENVHSCTGDLTVFESLLKRLNVNQLATSTVDDARARLHACEGLRVEHVLRFRRQRDVERDVIACAIEVRQGDQFHT